MMSKLTRNLFLQFTFFVVIIGALHFLLLEKVLPPIYAESGPWRIYAFLIPLEYLGLWLIYYRYQKSKTSAMNNFMFLLVVKMLGSIFFLAPWIFDKDQYTRPFTFQFFAIFFPLLLAEVVFLVKMLNEEPTKWEKKRKIRLKLSLVFFFNNTFVENFKGQVLFESFLI